VHTQAFSDHVEITKPDPKEHPDAYDAKGELVDMYKDPDMMLGFAERIKTYPNPHTKYDKVWVGPLAPGATVGQLKDAIEASFSSASLKASMITAPTQRLECEKDEENPSGLKVGARTLYSTTMRGTHANLDKPFVELLAQVTSRDEAKWPTIDDPIDLSKRLLYADLAIALEDDEGDIVTTPPIVIKLGPFDFVPYKEREARPVEPWLVEYASKKQRR
jgi:hypothetical protein